MVHQKYQPYRKPLSCTGIGHDDLMDDADTSYRHPLGNLLAPLGPAADAVLACARPIDLFLRAENNAAGT